MLRHHAKSPMMIMAFTSLTFVWMALVSHRNKLRFSSNQGTQSVTAKNRGMNVTQMSME